MTNQGHGHVFPRSDGLKARCGGPGLCQVCSRDLGVKLRAENDLAIYGASRIEVSEAGFRCISPSEVWR